MFFVVSNRGRSRINDEVCGYKNVLCIEYEELRYDNVDELRAMVGMLTLKFRKRFEYFFGANNPDLLSPESERNAVERLDATALAAAALKDEPPEKVDLRYGVRGGDGFNMDDSVPALIMPSDRRLRRRLSIALPGGGCEVTWPQPPKRRIQTSYAASYPGKFWLHRATRVFPFVSNCDPFNLNRQLSSLGCGARMTWNLVSVAT